MFVFYKFTCYFTMHVITHQNALGAVVMKHIAVSTFKQVTR